MPKKLLESVMKMTAGLVAQSVMLAMKSNDNRGVRTWSVCYVSLSGLQIRVRTTPNDEGTCLVHFPTLVCTEDQTGST